MTHHPKDTLRPAMCIARIVRQFGPALQYLPYLGPRSAIPADWSLVTSHPIRVKL